MKELVDSPAGFRQRLKEAREKAGLSQRDAAKLVRVSHSHISHIESGKVYPSLHVLVRIAGVYKTTPHDLICGDVEACFCCGRVGDVLSSEESLRERFPQILWDEPILISLNGNRWWGCRICMAVNGLKGSEIESTPFVYLKEKDAQAHLKEQHG